jgi:predicted RNase H-like HicB family nuclease
MLTRYLHQVIQQVKYSVDPDGVVIACIPGEQWYYAQGESFEQARDHLLDVIEMIMIDKIKDKDTSALNLLKSSILHPHYLVDA